MEQILLSQIPLSELKQQLRDIIKEELKISNSNIAEPKEPGELLTRKQVAKILKVSLVTLDKWRKEGKIKYIGIGSPVRFKYSDVMKALENRRELKYRF